MKLTRLLTGLAPALATAMFIGLAAPAAVAQDNNAPAAAPATQAAPATAAPAAPRRGSGSPRRAPELLRHGPRKVHRQFRRHGMAFDLGRARSDDDHPGPRPFLRRHGQQEECRRHGDDEFRHHLPGHGALLRRDLLPGVHRRQRLHRRLLARSSCRASITTWRAARTILTRSRRPSPRPST